VIKFALGFLLGAMVVGLASLWVVFSQHGPVIAALSMMAGTIGSILIVGVAFLIVVLVKIGGRPEGGV
jgi:hypothetical protein